MKIDLAKAQYTPDVRDLPKDSFFIEDGCAEINQVIEERYDENCNVYLTIAKVVGYLEPSSGKGCRKIDSEECFYRIPVFRVFPEKEI